MNKRWIIGIIILLIIGGALLYFFFGNAPDNQPSEYVPSRTSVNTTLANDERNSNTNKNETTNSINNEKSKTSSKKKISSFSTPIVDDHKNRINNIKITCSRISGTIVKPDKEFSFNKVAGQPSSKDGYKEAHIIVDGEVENGIGGGNCQVSTTIYNAAKKIDGVEITERHEHGRPVGYIEMGKDATVSYGNFDLKFENHNDFDLELDAYIKDDKVCVDIYKVL